MCLGPSSTRCLDCILVFGIPSECELLFQSAECEVGEGRLISYTLEVEVNSLTSRLSASR
jgi:hypothetical protein